MTSRSLLAAAAGLMLSLGASMAFAQNDDAVGNQNNMGNQNAMQEQTPETRVWTRAEVSPDNPFGDLDVNIEMVGEAEIPAFFNSLTPQQLAELQGRCGVLVQNEADYDEQAVTWCKLFVGAEQRAPAGGN